MEDIMKKRMVIYLLTDTTNGKQYVGQTSRTLSERLREHRNEKSCYIDRAIRKHGWENFTVKIIEECSTTDELNEREQYWIAQYGTIKPNGYNITAGGGGLSGYTVTQETKKKISATRKKSPVICLETGQIFDSITAAAAWAGVIPSAISYACRGKNRTSGGYHWRFFGVPFVDEDAGKVKRKPKGRPVLCVETGQVFEYINEAARWAKVHKICIMHACKNKNRTAGGYHWRFVDDPNPEEVTVNHSKRIVICVETKQIFESVSAAAKWAGVSVSAISYACRHEDRVIVGYHWRYCDSPDRWSVRCVETGEIFSSACEAAKWAGVSSNSILGVCRKLQKTAGGYHWEFVN